MLKVLLAVDGSDNALRAADKLIETAGLLKEPPQVELVTVIPRVPNVGRALGAVLPQHEVDRYYREQAEQALQAARAALQAAGLACRASALAGETAQTLVDHAGSAGCQMIWMGSRGLTPLSNFLLGSVATRVLCIASVPVVLVP